MRKQILSMSIVAIFTAIIALGGVFVGTHLPGRSLATNADAVSSVAPVEETAPPEVPKTIAIPGYARLVMKAGDLMQNVKLHNPAENPCYFVVSIILPDGTEVFRSGLLEPGQKIDAIKLSQSLEAGTYNDAILRYTCYSSKDKAPMNGADTKFILEVI